MRLGVRVWRPALYPIRLKYQTPGLKWHWQQGSLVSQGVGQDAVMYEVGVYLNVSFTRYRHTGHMAEYTKLHLLLIIHTWHRHRMISTEAQVLCMGQAQRSKWAKPSVCSSKQGKGEEGGALKHPSLLTTLMVVWKLLSGLRVVYVLGWKHPVPDCRAVKEQ